MLPVIAIIDVGKTNKKMFLFDQSYRIVWEQTNQFAEAVDEDGDACEDLGQLIRWVSVALETVAALPNFSVQAINFTAYGASFVYVDAAGNPVGLLYNYLKPFPAPLRDQFYGLYGPPGTLSVATASPALDSLNSGLQLYRLKHTQPGLFCRVAAALHLPQFLSFLVSGHTVSDLTSIGCHTLLWDFGKNQYHDWVIAEGLDRVLGTYVNGDQAIPTRVLALGRVVPVGVGLHDSSAALIPYLACFQEPFVLISTGTWCISMNPFNTEPLTAEELQYDCLTYLTYKGQPVKSSRLFAGHEHEQQVKRLAAHYNVPESAYKRVGYNPRIIEQLQQQPVTGEEVSSGLVPPVTMPSLTGSVFAQRTLICFPDYETAYHQLMLDLMAQQLISTALVLPGRGGSGTLVRRIFVDGGFSQNAVYMNLLAAAFPDMTVLSASVAQATALGAALAVHTHWNPMPIPANLISLTNPRAESQISPQANP